MREACPLYDSVAWIAPIPPSSAATVTETEAAVTAPTAVALAVIAVTAVIELDSVFRVY
jgi:hypothetical protein